jgi:UDP-N-acetylglucosamine/UDP-N-acetylgalactosamine diphosphorylase
MKNSTSIKKKLIERGVYIHLPETVEVGDDVQPEQVAPGVEIYGGCRLSGDKLSIGPGSVLGAEGPVTISNCQLGHGVELKGGYFCDAVFMDGVSFGCGAHVRGGTLLEEHASCAHTVGLKQTMLMPFVTLGSLINFCDCLMAGGTSGKDHSEVGSSYIHFNFTAHQDKATASLMGDVPQGVLLNQPPIFLGGQGGLVGPTRIAYGTVIAAGMLCRRDVLTPQRLVFGQSSGRLKEVAYDLRTYGDISRIMKNNFNYIGNLHALYAWYKHARPLLMGHDQFSAACLTGGRKQICAMIDERIKRLQQLADKLKSSLEISGGSGGAPGRLHIQELFVENWSSIAERIVPDALDATPTNIITEKLAEADGSGYLQKLRNFEPTTCDAVSHWLNNIVTSVNSIWEEVKNG